MSRYILTEFLPRGPTVTVSAAGRPRLRPSPDDGLREGFDARPSFGLGRRRSRTTRRADGKTDHSVDVPERTEGYLWCITDEGKGVRKEMKEMKHFLRRAWLSPMLLAVLVFVVEAARKFPKGSN
jgi:hypothetical protein